MNMHTRLAFPLAAIAAALLSVYGPAQAQELDEVQSLTTPESSIRVGAGFLSEDGPRFGQYTGLREQGPYGLVDLDIVKRDDATGTWLKFNGRNLGLDNRDLRFSQERQGDWGYYLEFSETPRFDPLTINTGLSGIGSTTQTLGGVAAPRRDVHLRSKRETMGLGFNKSLGRGFDVQVSLRSEEKDGARLWSNYSGTPTGINFLTEPLSSTTNQLEAIVNYAGDKLQLSGGYYGSTYNNHNPALNVNGSTGAPLFPMALPQDNEAHQLYLSGGYAFTKSTRGTFKVSSTRATQNDPFFTTPTYAPAAGNTRLNGRVDTTLMQMGLTSRPLPKLSLLANLRYEDRDDKTPRVQFLPASASRDGFNAPMSRRQMTGKAEASYQLPMAFRITGGVDVESIKRSITPTLRQVSWREKTDETSYRLELRRSMSETLNGAVSYVHSKRDGSPYLAANNAAMADFIDPIHWADRKRDKVRLSMDWTPLDPLSLQFVLEDARDKYDGRPLGPESGKARLYSIDASYTFSEAWQGTAWISRDENRMNQSTLSGGTSQWSAQLENVSNAIGFGVRGKASEKMQVGADLQYAKDTSKYGLSPLLTSSGLPDIHNKTTSLKLFGTYALQKQSTVRLDYIHDRRTTDDWTWSGFTYNDGTTVYLDPNQKVHFIGVSYIYKFQ